VRVFGRRDDETDHALKQPATKKAPRHEVAGSWAVAGSKRYGDRMSTLPSMVGASAAPDDVHVCMQGGQESAMGISAGTRSALQCVEVFLRLHGGRKNRALGSLAAGRVAESDWASVW
jgi:hypothetical protein